MSFLSPGIKPPPLPPPPPKPPTPDDAAMAADKADRLRRRQGAAADLLTGPTIGAANVGTKTLGSGAGAKTLLGM